ncbi:peroxiredoxin family protein [Aquiflexum sp.]|uniref:peroxiredoxin family protein n=1 Tax=Aquiflexum sp. TaxID=1872584 RepID=UPI003594825A
MKKQVKFILVIVPFIFVSIMGIMIIGKIEEKNETLDRISVLPPFQFQSISSDEYYSDRDLPQGKMVFIFHVNSTCDFCRYEAMQIAKNIDSFRGSTLVFVSSEEKKDMMEFAREFSLWNIPQVVFLQDVSLEFSNIFGFQSIPGTIVYGKDRKHLATFKGAVKAEKLLELIE